MSFDRSKLFQGNMTANVKDDFNVSPAMEDNYDYKLCIVKELKLNNHMDSEPRPKSFPRGKVNNQVTSSEKRGGGY